MFVRNPNLSGIINKKYSRIAVLVFSKSIFLALLLLRTIAAPPAIADPMEDEISAKQQEVDILKEEIGSISMAAEQAVENYNRANIELEVVREQMAQNRKSLEEVSVKLIVARQQFESRVKDVYKNGSGGFLGVLLGSSTFSDFISRSDLLAKIIRQDTDIVDRMLRYKATVEQLQTDLENTRQQHEELLVTVAEEQSEVEEQLAARQSALSGAEDDVAALLLEQQEQEAAAAEAAAAEAAAEAAETSLETAETSNDAADDVPPPPASHGDVIPIAEQYIGLPYVWGGITPDIGFDCSGLVMYVFAQVGISLPHFAEFQYKAGTDIDVAELVPGDLVFFGEPAYHVGIYAGGGSMIHASFTSNEVTYGDIEGASKFARL